MDSWLWICQIFKFGFPHWPWVNVQCQILKIPNTSCMLWGIWCYPFPSNYACSYPGQKTHITWQLWWISTFNPQAHFSHHDDERRNSSQLIEKTTKNKWGLRNKNWQPFCGKEHDAWHTYIPADKASFTCLSRTPPTPYKSVMLCRQKHGWWKITETPDESCWHMPVSNSFVMRLECVDFMGFACCFTNQIGTLFCQERANKGGDISTWWANYVFCSDSCYNNLFLSYTLFCKWFSTISGNPSLVHHMY